MLNRRQLIGTAGAAACLPALVGGHARAATSLDLSTILPDGNFHTENVKAYAAEVARATGGEVKILVQAGGSLGFKGPEHLRAVRDGLVPIADILVSQQSGDAPLAGAESLPFLVNSMEELRILHKHLRPEIEALAQKANQKVLYMVPWPTQYFYMRTRSENLAGLKGQKVRVYDKNAQDMCTALGMSPALIPWGETIPALASGAISGVMTSAVSGVDGRLWEFVKYVYPTNHTWTCQMVNINLNALHKLSPAAQKSMEQVARNLEPAFWDSSRRVDQESLKRLRDHGMEIMTISDGMKREMHARTAPLIEAFIKRVPASEKPLRAYLKEVGRA